MSDSVRAIAAAVVIGTIGAAFLLGLPGTAAPASRTPGAPSGSALPLGATLSPATCAGLEPPQALNGSLVGLYTHFTLQGYSGPNGTPALGISSYPNLSAGEAGLNADWSSICQGGQFGYAYGQANGTAGFQSGGELASDGHYVFFYGFGWQDSCPPTVVNPQYPCGATAMWTVDLVSDAVSGPVFTNLEETPLGPPPLAT